MLRHHRNKSSGFSLIELLLVLGVLAILLIAAFVVYPQVRDRNQTNQELTNLVAIKANVIGLYGNGKMSSLNNANAVHPRIFPSVMVGGDYSGATQARTSWGGDVRIAGGLIMSGPHRFSIQITQVPQGVCVPFLVGAAQHFNDIWFGDDPVAPLSQTPSLIGADG